MVCAALIVGTLAPPPTAASSSQTTERLAAVGKLWGHVRYTHPDLAYREAQASWDEALVQAVRLVRSAGSEAEFLAVVDGMLETLDDGLTCG